jgi:O-antigen biosynthesis protein WbqP
MPAGTRQVPSDRIGEIKLTWLGRFIRRTNLDELPQLINILKGEMSIVGPRPPIPSQEALVNMRAANGSLACRPGLTGLAQVSSYDGMTAEEKARFDGLYASRITFVQDARVIARTFRYLLSPPPTY